MRGKARRCTEILVGLRITPAYAGKRSSTSFRISSYQDHPRLCGEKRQLLCEAVGYCGSPPPMRGKACFFQLGDVPAGITPAYAGKRCRGSVPGSCTRDPPRLCGEKTYTAENFTGYLGSPPPMRGKGREHLQA